jgi:hypothetical protein
VRKLITLTLGLAPFETKAVALEIRLASGFAFSQDSLSESQFFSEKKNI